MGSLKAAQLRAWTPIWIRANGAEPLVDWAIVDEPFTDPFFEQTVERAMQHPFNRVFAQRTPIDVLEDLAAVESGLAPNGLIFHMSRCGSTLVAQMLAAVASTIVLSEAQPLDALLALRSRRTCDDELIVRWLRATTSALARPGAGERRLFVKFHAWHVLELPLIVRAFPDVPWIFLFREPRAVLRSHDKSPGAEALAGTLDPAYAGIEPRDAPFLPQDEYRARMLAAFCEAALRHADVGQGRFVDYAALPEIVLSELLDFFGVALDDGDAQRMHHVTGRDAKRAGAAFRPRALEYGAPELDRLAARWLDAAYQALVVRSRGGAPGGR
jgi:hypothetical protein